MKLDAQCISLIEKLDKEHCLKKEEYDYLLNFFVTDCKEEKAFLFSLSCKRTEEVFGKNIFIRGLIEFSNYCKNDCNYCGIRSANKNVERYRLSLEQILQCCDEGYKLGFRTFVLQGGEDLFFTTERIVEIVSSIKQKYPDCAVTLSIGEKSTEEYRAYKNAGADRYLLRHETADENHFKKLKPLNLKFSDRMKCLNDLKECGFQTGCGFMVGSPFQKVEYLSKDLIFIQEFKPEMVGIGPFIPHCQTPFKDYPNGSVELTICLIALLRLINPKLLIPSTTALASLCEDGRERGILAGANVVMPNLSPSDTRKKYQLYNNKKSDGSESAQCLESLKERLSKIDRQIAVARGDYF